MNQYTWYDMELSLSNSEEVASALIYSTNEFMSVQKNGGQIRLATTNDTPYIVLWRFNFKEKLPAIRVQIKNKFLNFKENVEYPYYNCPIKVEFFIDE